MEETQRFKPLRPTVARLLVDHQRWLTSKGCYGKQFNSHALDGELRFEDNNLEGIDLSQAMLADVSFVRGSLRGAKFIRADLNYAIFDHCDIEGTDFTCANLHSASFETNHKKAVFTDATLSETTWTLAAGRKLHYAQNMKRLKKRLSTPHSEPSP